MKLVLVLVLVVGIGSSSAQTPDSLRPSAVDAVGTEFTIFFQENAARRPEFTFQLQLFLTTHSDIPVTVRADLPLFTENGTPVTQEVIVTKGNVTEVNFNQTIMHIGSGISNKGIHILANAPIVVYGVNPQRFSSEGFIAIPNHLLGTEYYSVGMPAEDQHSQLGVVAAESGETEVTVTLPDNTELKVYYEGRSYSANDVIVVKLTQYQTFQLQHRNRVIRTPDGDMSGARIQCTKRCAAFSGNSRTSVDGASRDHLVEQLPPVSTWGREFAVPPTPERTDRPDILKIVCQQDGTAIMIDGVQKNCNAGGSIQESISTSGPHYVTATKPVMAATVVMSQNGELAAIQADPAMTLIIPEEQYAQTYTIATATWSGAAIDGNAYKNFLTVVIRRDRIDSVVIDGMNVNTAYPGTVWKDIPSTAIGGKPALVTTYFNISSGTHTISTLQDDTQFMCIVYGAGDRESYAYMGGMRLQVINPACTQVLQTTFGDGVDNDCDARVDEEFCDGEDDDNDGARDEDCMVRNAVIARDNITVFVGQTGVLRWTVYATDFSSFNNLRLYKQQPTATEVLLAEGNATLTQTQLFADTGRYSIKVSNAVKKAELYVVEVELTVTNAQTVDPGDYRLVYTAQDGMFDGVNRLNVQQNNQQYEIIAKDLMSGTTQYARSIQPEPRNLYFQEGRNYSLTFHSIGGKHLDDLPYRQFFNSDEATGEFQVIGLKKNYVTGTVTGLQDVKTVYELVDMHWTAASSFDRKVLAVRDSDNTVVDNAVIRVESLVRPSISCRFELNADNVSGRIVCDVTDVKVDLDVVYWEFDGNVKIVSPAVPGPYTASHTAGSSSTETYTLILDGIRADQWPSNTNTRTFHTTFNQTNGYTLSAETDISLSQFPSSGRVMCRARQGESSEPSVITCKNTGGSPAVSSVSWLANSNKDRTSVNGGETQGPYTSSLLREDNTDPFEYTVVLTINKPIIGSERYQVIFIRDGNQETGEIVIIGPTARPGIVTGSVQLDDQTGEVSIPAAVVGGTPSPTTYTWIVQQNDGSFSTHPAGQGNSSVVTTNADGNPTTTLNLSGPFTSPREVTLNVTSIVNGQVVWYASRSWRITMAPVIPVVRPGSVSGEIRNLNSGSIVLVATVTGGTPAADTFNWTLPDGTVLLPGDVSGDFLATNPVDYGNGTVQLTLTLHSGLTANPQTIVFRTSAGSSWSGTYTYNLGAKSIPPTISSSYEVNQGRVTVYMTVTGGSPPLSSYEWILQYNGRNVTLRTEGSNIGPYTVNPSTDFGNGSIQYSLTLRDLTELPTDITFRATSTGADNSVYWTAIAIQRIGAVTAPPTVACALRTNNLRAGDEVELVCTVQPTPVSGFTYTINTLIYTNIRADQSQRNISSTITQPGFRYEQKTNNDGTIDSSLFFTLPQDFSDVKNYNFIVNYNGGVIITRISLDAVFTHIITRPALVHVVGVESGVLTLTCNAQANSDISSDSLIWRRRSLGPSGRTQVVYENRQVQEPFKSTGRYIQTNSVTPDGLLASTLKITNLQRTDVAEYSCAWSNSVSGEFILDVIGASFFIDNQQFNGHLSPVNDNDIYRLTFEFESVNISDYVVMYGGIPQGNLAVTSRNGSRFDTFAQESIPVKVYTLTDGRFSPAQMFVIQTFYRNPNSENPTQRNKIHDYILTKKTVSSSSTDLPTFVHVQVNNAIYGRDETIPLIAGLPISLSVTVNALTCTQEIRIIIGTQDQTSQFTRSTAINRSRCIITFTRQNYIGNEDDGKIIQTVGVTPGGSTILSENEVSVTNPPPSSTAQPLSDKTDSCSDRNGGCHHRCQTDSSSSFHCECDLGFNLARNGRICYDNNECLTNNGGCDYICTNTEGSYSCSCPPGLRLSANGKSCTDDDECEGSPCLQTEKCVNTFGSYHCISACECNCCDAPTTSPPGTGRRKRAVVVVEPPKMDDMPSDSAAAAAVPFTPLNGIAILSWLLALSMFCVVTFYITIRNRVIGDKKISTLG